MSSAIVEPALTIAPVTWTELAPSAAVFAAETISAGVFEATPLPLDEPPHPARAASAASEHMRDMIRGRTLQTIPGVSDGWRPTAVPRAERSRAAFPRHGTAVPATPNGPSSDTERPFQRHRTALPATPNGPSSDTERATRRMRFAVPASAQAVHGLRRSCR
jgi:hypothetical protein